MNFSGVVRINKVGVIVILGMFMVCLFYIFFTLDKDKSSPSVWVDRESEIFQGKRDPSRVSLRNILIVAVDLAQRGGLEVVKVRNSSPTELVHQLKGHTKEGAKDFVTQGDFKSHRVMYYGMRKTFPKIKIISEEHTDTPEWEDVPFPKEDNEEISKILFSDEMIPAGDVSVWIDPLDATQEYTENLVKYVTTMVCVAIKGVPIIGVIHRPFTKETFWSVVGHGNSPNLDVLMSRREDHLNKSRLRILVSRSHAGEVRNLTKNIFAANRHLMEILQAAGAGYKVLEIVSGRADVYLHVTAIKKWDLCAGHAIMSALGGAMTNVAGGILDYSADTDPMNLKGLLAYLNPSVLIDQLKQIMISQ